MNKDKQTNPESRADLITKLQQNMNHEFEKTAPHGLWEFVPPTEHISEISLLCRRFGQEIEETTHAALQRLKDKDLSHIGADCDRFI